MVRCFIRCHCHCYSAALPIQSALKIIVAAWPASIFGFFDKRMNEARNENGLCSFTCHIIRDAPEIYTLILVRTYPHKRQNFNVENIKGVSFIVRCMFVRARSFYVYKCVNKYIKMPIYKMPLKGDQAQWIAEHRKLNGASEHGILEWQFHLKYANSIHASHIVLCLTREFFWNVKSSLYPKSLKKHLAL